MPLMHTHTHSHTYSFSHTHTHTHRPSIQSFNVVSTWLKGQEFLHSNHEAAIDIISALSHLISCSLTAPRRLEPGAAV